MHQYVQNNTQNACSPFTTMSNQIKLSDKTVVFVRRYNVRYHLTYILRDADNEVLDRSP